MWLKYTITIATLLLCLNSHNVFAETLIKIDYNADTDVVDLSANGISLEDVLNQLAEKLDFKVVLKTDDVHRKINLKMQGRTKDVLMKLIKPNNVILSQAETPPQKVTKVILLPTGDVQSRYLPKEFLTLPANTGNTVRSDKNKLDRGKLKQSGKNRQRRMEESELLSTNETLREQGSAEQ